jgi:hypothetical protein
MAAPNAAPPQSKDAATIVRVPTPPPGKVLVLCMPTRDGQVSIETHFALKAQGGPLPVVTLFEARKTVVEARNALAANVLRLRELGFDFDFVLWLDADAWWPPQTIERMMQTLAARPDVDILTAFSGERGPFSGASAFIGMNTIQPHDVRVVGDPPPIECYFTHGDVVEVDRASFHFLLMRAELLERVGPKPFDLSAGTGYGEDFCFCDRVRTIGGKIACDTGAIVAHVDVESGYAFIPLKRPGRIDGNAFVFADDPRSDDEIFREWEPKRRMSRRDRKYGADVEARFLRIGHAIGGKDPLAGAKRIGRKGAA